MSSNPDAQGATSPDTEYSRLLSAFKFEQHPAYPINYFAKLADLLSLPMSSLSDCMRKGEIVTLIVLEAAERIGISPAYLQHGKRPVYLENYAAPEKAGELPKKL